MNLRELFLQDLRSKVVDGAMSAFFLFLLALITNALISPIYSWAGLPGLLIYLLGLLAISLFSLEHALITRHADTTRAWYGAAGGLLAWAVTTIISWIWPGQVKGMAGILTLLMIALIVATLWRRALPLGARFYGLAFLLNWATALLYEWAYNGARLSPVLKLSYLSLGYLSGITICGLLAWVFFRSERRLQRVYLSLTICALSLLLFYFFSLPLP